MYNVHVYTKVNRHEFVLPGIVRPCGELICIHFELHVFLLFKLTYIEK